MKLSIISVVRNALPALQKTLSQLFELEDLDFEIVIVDGNSTDGTQDYLKNLKHKKIRFISESDTGIYNAMNKGIALAKGDFLYFLNAGDSIYSTESFRKIYSRLDQDHIYYCNILLSHQSNLSMRRYPSSLNLDFWFRTHMCHQAVIFKKEAFQQIGNYNESYRFAADFDFLLRAWSRKGISFQHIDELISVYDMNGVSANPANYKKVVR